MISRPVSIRRYAPLVALALLALALLLAAGPVGAQTTIDYDDDDDGLIDIRTPAQLDAIRHNSNGNGQATHADYMTAFSSRQTGAGNWMGCPAGTCTGYELRADMQLSGYANWAPIDYSATFEGNGYTIYGLTIDRTQAEVGLFSNLRSPGVIRNVGIVEPNLRSGQNFVYLGALVGYARAGSDIRSSFVRGGSVTATNQNAQMGGLVGYTEVGIRASYAQTRVGTDGCQGGSYIGGMVGYVTGGSTIEASYAAGTLSAPCRAGIGCMVGYIQGSSAQLRNNYCNGEISGGISWGVGGRSTGTQTVASRTTAAMQEPTGYTGDYENWNINLGGAVGDDPWDFGSSRDYPLLKADKNGDNTATWQEFGGQYRYRERVVSPPPYNWRTDHPEIYHNARHGITASCEVTTTGEGDEAVTTATITFDLAEYARPISLALSRWSRDHFRSLESLGLAMPELRRDGQTATVEVVTDPARTRFRLDGQYGLNLVLGYADCHTDDP